jgi:hypothetical protein
MFMPIVRIVDAEPGDSRTVMLADLEAGGADHLRLAVIAHRCFEIELENNYLPDAFYNSTHLRDAGAQAVLLVQKDDNPELSIAWGIIAPRPDNGFRIGWLQTAPNSKKFGHGGFLLRKTLDYLFTKRNADRITLEDASHGTGTRLYRNTMAEHFDVAQAGDEFTYKPKPALAHHH